MFDIIHTHTALLSVGDFRIINGHYDQIVQGSVTVDLITGEDIIINNIKYQEVDEDTATAGWEDGKKVFEVDDGEHYIGLWTGC